MKRAYTFTKEQLSLLQDVYNGADVYALHMASFLRELERDGTQLVSIVEAKTAPDDGALQQPYFGCILTKYGRIVVDSLTDYPRHKVRSLGRHYSMTKEVAA